MAGTSDANIAVRVGADITPLQRDIGKARKELSGFEKSAGSAGRGIAAVGAAGAAAAAAFGAMAVQAGMAARELQTLSRISGVGVEEFQRFARVSRDVGVQQEQLGDIFKDTNEKLGEFIATGGGGFADFAERMGMSAFEVSKQFKGLSGPQVLGKMKTMLDAANVPLKQQVFFFESVASESSKLIPIFGDLSRDANTLAGSMKAIILTEQEIESLSEMGSAFSNLGDTLGNVGDRLMAWASPVITEWIAGLNDSIVELADNTLPRLEESLKKANEQMPGGEKSPLQVADVSGAEEGVMFGPDLDEVATYLDELQEAYGQGFRAINDLVQKSYGEQTKFAVNSLQDISASMSTNSKKMFELHKAFQLGNAIVSGYRAATEAWSYGMAVGGPPTAVAFTAASIARTAALINGIRSTSFGGGGGAGAGGGGSVESATPAQSQQQENQIVTINLEGEVFGRQQIGGLISQINEALDDGYTLRINS